MLAWQDVHELLQEARRRSPRREREALGNQLADVKRGAKLPPPGKDAAKMFRSGAHEMRLLLKKQRQGTSR